MGLCVNIVAERSVENEFLVAAAGSSLRLSEAAGLTGESDFRVQEIGDNDLKTNRLGQVDCAAIDTIPEFVRGGLTMVITARDLGVGPSHPRRLNFVFGMSHNAKGKLILSTHRMRSTGDFGALATHEGGHSLGLVNPLMKNYDNDNFFPGHCVNDCVMQPAHSYDDMPNMVRQNERAHPFCGDCTGYLNFILPSLPLKS